MTTTRIFQAETKELLDLMIHSLYSHREIFLRELISNASDAIEKLKFESLTQPHLVQEGSQPEIRLSADSQKRTLTISDNGIGMSYDEVIENLGTIAHSGTKSFLNLRQDIKANPDLIGQFGVGFYSAFMVADQVVVHTQKAGTSEGTVWKSDGRGEYTLDTLPRPEGSGTSVTLHLKNLTPSKDETSAESETHDASELGHQESQDFTDTWVLRELVKKYSDFIAYPVRMQVSRTKPVEGGKAGETETVIEDETFNTQKALWLRPSSEISEKEYHEFYQHLVSDWSERLSQPLKSIHYKAEGSTEFTALLYIPSKAPMDYRYRDRKIGLNLYVKRVFIKSNCEELIPSYLRFVRGVVETDDLSLNVSREILQQNQQIQKIKKALTGKVLGSLKELLEQNRESYEKFWGEFGSTLKEGCIADFSVPEAQKEKLKALLLFHSTESDRLTSLSEYVGRMKEGQKGIYTITGESLSRIKNSPYLEKIRAKGFEVLLMTDPVDAWVSVGLESFDSKPFISITAENLDLDTEAEKEALQKKLKDAEGKFKPMMETMQETLKDRIKQVRVSDRLTESPVCLVSSDRGASAHMERVLKSMGQPLPNPDRILEINPDHPIYEKMLQASKETQQDWSDILYQQALLNEGSSIEDPLHYSQKIAKLMLAAHL